MRFVIGSIALLVLLAACSGPSSESTEAVSETDTPVPETTAVAPVSDNDQTDLPEVEEREVWKGFSATTQAPQTLAAMARGPVDVYESPDSPQPEMSLEGTTILGTVTVLAVVDGPIDGWVEVMLPVRPNGSTGWVELDAVSLYVADSEISIDLSDRRLTYVVDGVEVLATDVGVGSEHNQTPTGQYFVTDSVTLADPNSPWGPHALGISARSETITEFNGGDGIIGIHGTNNPGSIGGNISLGCVRLPNDMITALYELVPIGTRVTVNA